MKNISNESRFVGAFMGFAVGDAFGYPCREMDYHELCERFEKEGCLQLAVSKKTDTAVFSDATQLMLFTADGIIWAASQPTVEDVNYVDYVFYAYQYWVFTQTKTVAGKEYAWLFDKTTNKYKSKPLNTKGLHKERRLDDDNVNALLSARNLNYGKLVRPINDNAGNGAVKRVLPAGLHFNYNTALAFRAGADFAAITHGSPTSCLAAGAYAAIIAEIVRGANIDAAIEKVKAIILEYGDEEKCFRTLEKVQNLLADNSIPPLEAVRRIGTGNSAVDALGVSVFCAALHEDNFADAIRLAVNHDGASEVCGAMCGGILGAYHGAEFIPKKWLKKMPYLRLIEDMALLMNDITYFEEGTGDNKADARDKIGSVRDISTEDLGKTSEIEEVGFDEDE